MRNRFLLALVAALLVLSGCSDDSSSDNGGDDTDSSTTDDSSGGDDDGGSDSSGSDDADDGGDDGDSGDSGDAGGDDTDGGEPVTFDPEEDPFAVNPVAATEQIIAMVEEAQADGEVTGEEMGDILEFNGAIEAHADCEGALLAELGVTDPLDVEQLTAATQSMTEEQLMEFNLCMTGN